MKMNPFRAHLLSATTAAVFSAIFIVSTVSIVVIHSTIERNINDQMTLKLDSLSDAIEIRLNEHSSLVKSLALLSHKNAGNISSIEHMIILKNMEQHLQLKFQREMNISGITKTFSMSTIVNLKNLYLIIVLSA